jgi:hypothetical protein
MKENTIKAANNIATQMTGWFKSFIGSNHVQTGLMRDVTSVGIMTAQYDGLLRITLSLKTTSYFKDVERQRKREGKETMMKLARAENSEVIQELKKQIIIDYGQEALKTFK